ncbi:D-arabinono-1,4-lactone oxidase [Gynuella sp.]|uniref:D-arabinono-1,4-lactone oxidase n=1 Tax=Gynuella sp. TaxID=2969146 RepID=UPI003D127F2C
MTTTALSQWQNWSGYVSASPQKILRPADQQALQELIREAPAPLRFVGSGHSFTPLVASSGSIIDLSAFTGLLDHNADEMTATIGAATRLSDLMKRLQSIGQGLPNMGDIDKQTIAGALGTATHGTGITLGAYHTQLQAMTFVDGCGDVREFIQGRDDDMIHATGVTLGAFGALTQITMKNVPGYRLRRQRRSIPVTDMLNNLDTLMSAHRTTEFFVIPYSDQALYVSSDLSDQPPSSRPAEEDEDGLNTLKALRNWLSWFPWLRRKLIGSALAKVPMEDYVQEWLNVYVTDRRTRFNEMEYHLPFEAGASALRELIKMAETRFPEVYFPLEVRAVAADDFWLSPFYQRPTCSIAVHHLAGENPQPYFHAAEEIFRRYDGRPHWGKMHNLNSRDFARLYPRWQDAMEVRRSMDPAGRFLSPYLQQILST